MHLQAVQNESCSFGFPQINFHQVELCPDGFCDVFVMMKILFRAKYVLALVRLILYVYL